METTIKSGGMPGRQRQFGVFGIGAGIFLRLLAISHGIAFGSAWVQLAGLVGPHGLLPAARFFAAVHEQLGSGAWLQVPSLCLVFGSGAFLQVLCAAGLGLAVLVFCGIAPALCLALLWACYLSLVCAGQIFFDFQWDALLLETTLAAIFLAPWSLLPGWRPENPPRLARGVAWWLLFRLMFLSGIVKLASGDPNWRHLTALSFHYQTQPLPTPLAWYAQQLPGWFQRLSCGVMFAIELAAPFGIIGPRAIRHAAAASLIGLQAAIALTGNYTFFNLLAVALCVACFDDESWRRLASGIGLKPGPAPGSAPGPASVPARAGVVRMGLLRGFAAVAFFCTTIEAVADFSPLLASAPAVGRLVGAIAPFRSLNNYGLFAVMTTERPELVIEGSDDGRDWLEYELPHKPGNLGRRPDFVAPNQPRLDWQLWFAALAPAEANPWVGTLCERLLRNDPAVLGLFARNPFPVHPPHSIRVVRYRYEFTNFAEKAKTGNWWRRTPLDFYIQPVELLSTR